jgi:pimeloyl-ACP methyl ester carboxylesterase
MSRVIDDARALLAHMPRPVLIATRRGSVECLVAGEGPAVLALHGGIGGYDQGALLAMSAIGPSGVRLVAPSRPGYLGTPLAAGASPEEQADLFAALIDALGLSDVAVIAVSGGGPSALAFALRHSGRCRALVLVSACTARLTARMPLRFHVMRLLARWPKLLALLGAAARDPERAAGRSIADPQARAALMNDPEARALFMALTLTIPDRLASRLPGTENDYRRFSSSDDYPLEQIAVPVLAVHGTGDRIVAFSHARGLADRVPGAELLAIEGGEHVCLFTHRKVIRERVRKFLGLPAAE